MNFLNARWQNLVMANYAVPSVLLEPHLPPGTQLDFFEGKTYISLVGFLFARTRVFGVPVPWLGTFEEINLRFYVLRREGGETRRGVVFINETVPSGLVAWVANKLYYEHYSAVPTRHSWHSEEATLSVEYKWKLAGGWNHLRVLALVNPDDIVSGSIEEFIFEHYYGYTALKNGNTQEYKVEHSRWQIHAVTSYSIDCDFSRFYGPDFAFLSFTEPDSILLAAGSPVAVKWKRRDLDLSVR